MNKAEQENHDKVKKELVEEKIKTTNLIKENANLAKQLMNSQRNFSMIRENYDNEKLRLDNALNALSNFSKIITD